LLLSPSDNIDEGKFGTFGVYKEWVRDTDNSVSSVIGNYGSELDSDGAFPQNLIGGSGNLGASGGGEG